MQPSMQEVYKPDWYERITKAGLLIVGILGLLQDRQSWFPYVFLFVVFLLSIPWFGRLLGRWHKGRLEKKMLNYFLSDFRSHVNTSRKFLDGSNDSIPFNIRPVLIKLNPSLAQFSMYVEGLLSNSIKNLQERVRNSLRTYNDFKQVSTEFSDIVSAAVLIYVDQIIRELNKTDNREKLTEEEIASFRKRLDSFVRFIEEYNGFQGRIAAYLKQEQPAATIRTPFEVLR